MMKRRILWLGLSLLSGWSAFTFLWMVRGNKERSIASAPQRCPRIQAVSRAGQRASDVAKEWMRHASRTVRYVRRWTGSRWETHAVGLPFGNWISPGNERVEILVEPTKGEEQ